MALFWHSVAVTSMYLNEIPTQLPGMLTSFALTDLASGSTSPNSLFSSRLSLTVAFPQLLLILPFHCSGTLPFLVFFWSCRKSHVQALCVGFAPKQMKESFDWRSSTPTPIQQMPTIMPYNNICGKEMIRKISF